MPDERLSARHTPSPLSAHYDIPHVSIRSIFAIFGPISGNGKLQIQLTQMVLMQEKKTPDP